MKLLPLGIQIYQSEISNEFYDFLLSEYENNLDSYPRILQNQNYWGGSDRAFLNDQTKPYIEKQVLKHAKEYVNYPNLSLRSQWINIQAHEGFVPLHTHSGNISYVIYLKVPDYLKNYYNKRNNAVRYAEGAIDFIYGHKNSLFPDDLSVYPREKMILMFPAEVRHYVFPFKDKESQRVSVAGNIEMIKQDPQNGFSI